MPEYSSTTITPADGVKTPAMNGSTSGNYTLSALRDFILASKGSANGLASLDSNGKLPSAQLPDLADDVLVYASYASFPASGTAGKLYIAGDTNKIYRWDDSLGTPAYVYLKVDWTDLTDGSVTVKKAECDASGNTITSTYETKADANNLKDAINQHDARLENLEQKAGDYSIVQYRGTNAVPTGKAKYGLVKSIVGKTRAWNQLAKAMNATNWQFGGSTGSFSDGTATYTASGQYGCVRIFSDAKFNLFANHYYLISAEIKTTSATTSVKLALNWNGSVGESAVAVASSTSWQTVSFIVPFGATGYNDGLIQVFDARTGSWDAVQVRNAICRDVGLILNDWNTSDITTANIPLMVRQVPDLLKWDAFNAGSLVDTEVSAVKSVGVNIWDEVAESGGISSSDGNNYTDATLGRSKNYIPVKPNTVYYAKTSQIIYLRFYDENKGYIGYGGGSVMNGSFTTPQGCYYMRFVCDTAISDNSIQICLNSYADKTTYHPYKSDTLSLPETVTLRSAGSVADELDVESGVVTHHVGSQNLGDWSWDRVESNVAGIYYFITQEHSEIKVQGDNYTIWPNALMGGYTKTSASELYLGTASNKSYGMYDGYGLRIRDDAYTSASAFKTAMNGVYLNYELATLTTESIDPVPYNFLEVEGGGTVDTIQTQTPIIDNCLDVGYLAV